MEDFRYQGAVKPGHVPGLDGLRGAAVAAVVVFHSAPRTLRGGYLGVDLFFVLSGFLITSILVAERQRTGRIDLGAFWVRRARRLLPALLSLMPIVAIYARMFASSAERAEIRGDALAALAYVTNWRAVLARRSYWAMFDAPSPLEHTWSLAIEEQFYVVWPLVVAAVLALTRGRTRALFAVSAALGVASAIAMAVLYDGGEATRVYLGTDTRGAAILIGAALATSGWASPAAAPSRLLDAAGLAALALLGAAWWRLDGQQELLYRGGFWVTEIAAATLVLSAVRHPAGPVARALSVRPLRALGTISYGVYLWHWPIDVALTEERLGRGGAALLAARLGLALGVAWASYRWIERPIRERGLPWPRPWTAVTAALIGAAGVVLLATRGAAASSRDLRAAATASPIAGAPPSLPGAPRAPVPFGFIPPASELAPGALRVLVLGDSVALSLGARLHFAADPQVAYVDHRAIGDCSILHGIAPVFSMSGPPHDNGNCAKNWASDVEELRPDVALVVLGGAYFSTVKVDGRRRNPCHRGWHDAYLARLSGLLREMAPFAARRAVLGAAYPVGKWRTSTVDETVDCYNAILREAAGAAEVEWIDLNAFLCPDGACATTSRGAAIRPDGLHFDGIGAEDTARWLLARLGRDVRP